MFRFMYQFLLTRPARMAGLFISIALIGCPESKRPESAAKPRAAVDAPPVSLSMTDADGLRAAIERHHGKVVLIDFWATWCLPCVEQFPHTVELARKYRERGLAVISVSMDSPKSEAQVLAFLENHQADFDNLIGLYASAVDATKAFALPGPVPCYRVYDREGELRREFSVDPRAEVQFTAEDVERVVVDAL